MPGLVRRAATSYLFSFLVSRSAWVREPSCGSLTTLHAWGSAPRPRLGYGPRSDRFVPLTRRLVRCTNIFARGVLRAEHEKGALIGCFLGKRLCHKR